MPQRGYKTVTVRRELAERLERPDSSLGANIAEIVGFKL